MNKDQFVTIEAHALKQALAPLISVIGRRNTLPILANVKLAFSKNTFTLTGTNLDIEVEIALDVIDGAGAWVTTVPARILNRIADAGGKQLIRIHKRTEDVAILFDDGADYNLNSLSAENFPILKGERGTKLGTFTNGQFAQNLSRVRPFISNEETRYYLNGVFWRRDERGSFFIATDGWSLAKLRISPDPIANELSMIIPSKAVSVICKHLVGDCVTIFAHGDNEAVIEVVSDQLSIKTKLIDAAGPVAFTDADSDMMRVQMPMRV